MPLKLSNLYASTKDAYRIRLIGGSAGLDKMVNWVHLLEDVQTVSFIRGSELVLTTGVSASGGSQIWLPEFVRALSSANASGLVINTGKYIHAVPQDVINLCDTLCFPIFTIPWEIHLVDIVRDFCNRIFESDQSEESVTKAFRRAIFQPGDRDAYLPFLESHGYNSEGYHRVFTIHEKASLISDKQWAEQLDTTLRNKLNREGKVYHVFRHEDMQIIIFPNIPTLDDARSIAQTLCATFGQQFVDKKLRIGVGPAVRDIGRLRKTYRRALLALRFAQLNDECFVMFETMGLYRMLLSTDDTDILREMLDENLGKLIRYDQKNGSDNMEILRLYIQNNFSVQQVGQKTFMHRNTINYRVRKIKEILGNDLESMDEKLKCLLSFYIYDIMR